MILLIIILTLLLFLTWILLAPVAFFVDTDGNKYLVSLPGIFSIAVVPDRELFYLRFRIFFIPYRYHPFMKRSSKKKPMKEPEEKPVKKKKKRRFPGGIGMVRELAGAFRIRKLYLNIDTDDVIVNAWLIPALSVINSGNIRMQVNFDGDTSLLLDLRTRLGSLLWVFARNRIKSFFNL